MVILKILDTLGSPVSDSDLGGMSQRECDMFDDSGGDPASAEAAFLADCPHCWERRGPPLNPVRRPGRATRAIHRARSAWTGFSLFGSRTSPVVAQRHFMPWWRLRWVYCCSLLE